MRRVVIAGGGLAGQRAAEALRALGHDGPITMLAAERHLPYDRPPLSKAVLAGDDADLSLRPATWHRENGVELLTGTPATGLEPGRVRTPDGEVPYDDLVIATGARPITLPGLPHAQALRTLDDARRLREHLRPGARIAVIGAGLIGQEIASAAAAKQAHATLIDVAVRPFDALLGPGQGDWLRARHERAGVTLRLGRRLIATDDDALLLDDGTTVTADHVVVAIGVRPEIAWACRQGIPRPPGGPGAGDTNGVHLAGDCTGSAHWEAAVRQANAVARTILGLPAKPEAPPLVWSDQHGSRIQRLGDPRHADRVHKDGGDSEFTLTFTRRGRIVAATLVNRPHDVAKARRALQTPRKEAA
jgi:3-phenylpropionate/trans-cinnamate dioxygenase ferredoxin reductase subunit